MDTGKCIANMIKCRRGEHPLFRSFGLDGVDDITGITRSSLQVEVARWYPSCKVQSVTVDTANGKGEFEYTVKVEGR